MPAQRLACHENLECLLSGSRRRLMHAISNEAAAFPLFRDSLPADRLIPFSPTRRMRPFLNDDHVIRHSDLTERLTRSGATAFLPSYRSSRFLERWGREAGLDLLSPGFQLQRTLEDKIRFHGLLERHGLPAPAGGVLATPDGVGELRFPLVCQTAAGEGMEGTFLVGSRRQLRARIETRALRLPILCREFIRGTPMGITIVVGARKLILSAVRVQCRRLHHREQDLAGVQWIARGGLSSPQRRTIERTMESLGAALQQVGFRGAANVDFMLSGDAIYVIECNPRFSSSTPQLAASPELLHGLDFVAEYLRAVRGRPLRASRPALPDSSQEGAYVDVSDLAVALMKAAGRRVVREMPPIGVYELTGDRLRFVSTDVSDLRGGQRLLYHYSTPAGTPVGARSDLGSVMTRFPVFSFKGRRSALTRSGKALMVQLLSRVRLAGASPSLADLLSDARSPTQSVRATTSGTGRMKRWASV
jgi:hypothetical protein